MLAIRLKYIGIGQMKWFIKNDLFIIPDPGVFTCGDCKISLLRVIVVNFKEQIKGFIILDEEGVRDEFRGHIRDILRFKQGVYPALKFIEMKRRIAAVNADRPLLPSRNKRNTASHPERSSADEANEQAGEDKEYRLLRKFPHSII